MLSRMPGHSDCWHLIVIGNLFLWVGNLGRLDCHPQIASHLSDLQKHSSQLCSHNGDLIILKNSHNTLYCWISVTFRQVHLRQVWWALPPPGKWNALAGQVCAYTVYNMSSHLKIVQSHPGWFRGFQDGPLGNMSSTICHCSQCQGTTSFLRQWSTEVWSKLKDRRGQELSCPDITKPLKQYTNSHDTSLQHPVYKYINMLLIAKLLMSLAKKQNLYFLPIICLESSLSLWWFLLRYCRSSRRGRSCWKV